MGGWSTALYRSMAAPCLAAGALLGVLLWRRAAASGTRLIGCLAALVLCAGNPLTIRALEIGHPEELLGGVLCVGAALAAGARRPLAAGLLLGLAVANKPWAVLAIAPVVLMLPAGRMRALTAAAAPLRWCWCRCGPSAARRSSSRAPSRVEAGRSSSPGRCGGSSASTGRP